MGGRSGSTGIAVARNALVASAVRPAGQETEGRDNVREPLVDRLPEHLERRQIHVGTRRRFRGIVADDIDLEFLVVNPVPDVVKRLVDAFTGQDADKRMSIPLISPLQKVLDASPLGKVTFLETDYGQPFAIAGFENKFRQWCNEAGLQGLSVHGVRETAGIIAAERDATVHEIMAILGHSTLEEAEPYTREANAAKLADSGFAKAFRDEG